MLAILVYQPNKIIHSPTI